MAAQQTFEFVVVLDGISELTDDMVNALFEAGCDDGLPASSRGQAFVDFARQAASYEEAVSSAVASVERTGLKVARVERLPTR